MRASIESRVLRGSRSSRDPRDKYDRQRSSTGAIEHVSESIVAFRKALPGIERIKLVMHARAVSITNMSQHAVFVTPSSELGYLIEGVMEHGSTSSPSQMSSTTAHLYSE